MPGRSNSIECLGEVGGIKESFLGEMELALIE